MHPTLWDAKVNTTNTAAVAVAQRHARLNRQPIRGCAHVCLPPSVPDHPGRAWRHRPASRRLHGRAGEGNPRPARPVRLGPGARAVRARSGATRTSPASSSPAIPRRCATRSKPGGARSTAIPSTTVEHGMFEDDAAQHPAAGAGRDRATTSAASPHDIALTRSTTEGLALVYHGLPLKAGDEVLTTVHDHYSHHESIRLRHRRAPARRCARSRCSTTPPTATADSHHRPAAAGDEAADARGRPDLGAFQHRHPPADPRDRRGAEGEASRRAAGGRWRARHRRGRRNHRHDGRRLLLRRLPQVDVRAARHRPDLGQRAQLGAPAPHRAQLQRLGVVQAWGRGPRPPTARTTPRA